MSRRQRPFCLAEGGEKDVSTKKFGPDFTRVLWATLALDQALLLAHTYLRRSSADIVRLFVEYIPEEPRHQFRRASGSSQSGIVSEMDAHADDVFAPFHWVLYGSPDGVDHDVVVRVSRPLTTKETQSFNPVVEDMLNNETPAQYSLADKKLDVNFAVVTNGNISWCFKGTPDELNNSLLLVYELQIARQKHPNFVTSTLPRNITWKILRAVRVLICSLSRGNARALVEPVIKSVVFSPRIAVLKKIEFQSLEFTLRTRDRLEDIWKQVAFQMGQTLALVEGVELFSKHDCVTRYPVLEPLIYRKEATCERLTALTAFKNDLFLPRIQEYVDKHCPNIDSLSEFEFAKSEGSASSTASSSSSCS